jgi:predicted ATPase with chaperone activity
MLRDSSKCRPAISLEKDAGLPELSSSRLLGYSETIRKPGCAKLGRLTGRVFLHSVTLTVVSDTIADLEGAESLAPKHLSEAIQYRTLDGTYWA